MKDYSVAFVFLLQMSYYIESLVMSKFRKRKEMCFNGELFYLYGDFVLKLNSRHT